MLGLSKGNKEKVLGNIKHILGNSWWKIKIWSLLMQGWNVYVDNWHWKHLYYLMPSILEYKNNLSRDFFSQGSLSTYQNSVQIQTISILHAFSITTWGTFPLWVQSGFVLAWASRVNLYEIQKRVTIFRGTYWLELRKL